MVKALTLLPLVIHLQHHKNVFRGCGSVVALVQCSHAALKPPKISSREKEHAR